MIESPRIGRSVNLEFIPPWYANELVDQSRGQGEQYLKEMALKLPDHIIHSLVRSFQAELFCR